MRKLILITPALALTACGSSGGSYVDLGPVESGLNFVGFSFVLGVLLAVIAAFIMKGGGK
ncbi:MAG: hypothetical protein ACOYOI_08945 [Chthoniobacterales bacterium]